MKVKVNKTSDSRRTSVFNELLVVGIQCTFKLVNNGNCNNIIQE